MTATLWIATRPDRERYTRCWRCDNTDQTPCHTDRRWQIGITHRGWDSTLDQIALRSGACRATVETNGEYDFARTDPRIGGAVRTALLYRGACLACGWAGPTRRDDCNAAVEDAHDHTLPEWRDLPIIARHPHEAPSRIVDRWALEVDAMYTAHGFGTEYGPRHGGLIRTMRHPHGTRSHHVTGLDYYDVCAATTTPTHPTPAVEQPSLFT